MDFNFQAELCQILSNQGKSGNNGESKQNYLGCKLEIMPFKYLSYTHGFKNMLKAIWMPDNISYFIGKVYL